MGVRTAPSPHPDANTTHDAQRSQNRRLIIDNTTDAKDTDFTTKGTKHTD
jgi:hypothetical protein